MTEDKKDQKRLFSWLWGIWVGLFAIIELLALRSPGGNTLSTRVSLFVRQNKWTMGFFTIFMAWLSWHWGCE